ncbi:hypothetical protein GCK32_009913 [Trichostrongylus colubriformis]|uniref:EGF-like domain-containing protein n=1 Tax=Trichostrongylus colubriformis TaxID=6319 RepID=A0AAN8IZA7_TRICO
MASGFQVLTDDAGTSTASSPTTTSVTPPSSTTPASAASSSTSASGTSSSVSASSSITPSSTSASQTSPASSASALTTSPGSAGDTTISATTVTGASSTTDAGTSASSTSSSLPSTSTIAPTTETTTTPLQMATVDVSNDKTAIDGKLLLQKSVALSNEVQSLIDEITALEASVNATNSPYFSQMTQMQEDAKQMDANLTGLLVQLNKQIDRQEKLSITVANFTKYYECFAASQCVTPTAPPTTTVVTTAPPLLPCPTVTANPVTDESQQYDVPNNTNIRCSVVFTADDNFNVVLDVNVTIYGSGAALNIINARTGSLIKSFVSTEMNAAIDTKVQSAQVFYSADWKSSIEFNISYYAVNQSDPCGDPGICNNGTCTVDPNTGGVLCLCRGCEVGSYCETETDPCGTATAERKCRIGKSPGPGTCAVDDSITDYCAYKCNCTFPVEGVTNQCASSDQSLQSTWWRSSQEFLLSPLHQMWKNVW